MTLFLLYKWIYNFKNKVFQSFLVKNNKICQTKNDSTTYILTWKVLNFFGQKVDKYESMKLKTLNTKDLSTQLKNNFSFFRSN